VELGMTLCYGDRSSISVLYINQTTEHLLLSFLPFRSLGIAGLLVGKFDLDCDDDFVSSRWDKLLYPRGRAREVWIRTQKFHTGNIYHKSLACVFVLHSCAAIAQCVLFHYGGVRKKSELECRVSQKGG